MKWSTVEVSLAYVRNPGVFGVIARHPGRMIRFIFLENLTSNLFRSILPLLAGKECTIKRGLRMILKK
jgi:hypothetical protein